ncbi:hypothetical protein H5T87_05345 [bacterium]|nr:hypothetical protein [bacterium]
MLIEGASLYLGNWKVFSLPPFKVSLNQKEREKESAFALPRIELNRSTGFALTESITFNFRNSSGRLKIGYSTKKKFLGRFSLPISPSFNLIFSRYEEVKGKTISPLFISEEPNITWQKGNSSISFGRFFEEPTKQESKRLKFAISRPLLTAKMGGTLSLQISGRGSYSLYEGRESYRALGGEIQLKDNRASSQTNIAIGYLATGGSTPFVFDTEELTSYARLDWRKEGRDLIWELSGIWDLKNAKLYDAIVTLYKKVHCLAPGISWQKRGGIFSFQMKILGFEM